VQIFIDLNKATPLSTYELIAARWENVRVAWPQESTPTYKRLSQEIDQRISRTYQQVSNEYEYNPEVEDFASDDYSLYDLLYSLSRLSGIQVNGSNPDSKRPAFNIPSHQDQLAFDIMNLFITGRSGDVSKLAYDRRLSRAEDDRCDAEKIIGIYNSALSEVDTALLKTRQCGARFVNSAQLGSLQATAYAANYLALSTNRDFTQRKAKIAVDGEQSITSGAALGRWKKNCLAWWLCDIFSEEFIGSAASQNTARRAWDQSDEPATVMLNPPPIDRIVRLLNDAFARDSSPRHSAPKQRSFSVKANTFVIASLMHISAIMEIPTGKGTIYAPEADHVIPFKPRGGVYPAAYLTNPIPVNHIANWMPLEKTLNASRGNKPWNEFIVDEQIPDVASTRERLLIDPSYLTLEAASSPEAFLKVMARRWYVGVFRVLENLSLREWTVKSPAQKTEFMEGVLLQDLQEKLDLYKWSIDLAALGLTTDGT
jgi:hypothetical protein